MSGATLNNFSSWPPIAGKLMYNESVELHVLSIEGSDKTRIRRTNGTPHLYIVPVTGSVRQKVCLHTGVIHKKRVLFVSPLFVGNCQIFNWGLRDRTFYVCIGSLRPYKVRKNFQPHKQHSGISCVRVSYCPIFSDHQLYWCSQIAESIKR